MFDDIIQLLKKHNIIIDCLKDQYLSQYTTVNIGGKVSCMCYPSSIQNAEELLKILEQYNIPYFVLGKGSNLLVNDEGLDILVINTAKLNHMYIDPINKTEIIAESGVTLEELSLFALENSLTGVEFACGIPGSVGGAVVMNAGAYGGEIKDILKSSVVFDKAENISVLSNKEHDFSYRYSSILNNKQIILASTFQLQFGEKEQIEQTMNDLTIQRISKQPLELPSFGSVFKRPEGYFAGKLIMDSNLQGYKIGGASISMKHAGFIVNTDKATAQDVLSLIKYIQKIVEYKFNIHLEPEVKILEKNGSFRNIG